MIDEREKALDSIRVNEQSASKVTIQSDLQFEKHSDPMISTRFGI
jgi:hypothetical protein